MRGKGEELAARWASPWTGGKRLGALLSQCVDSCLGYLRIPFLTNACASDVTFRTESSSLSCSTFRSFSFMARRHVRSLAHGPSSCKTRRATVKLWKGTDSLESRSRICSVSLVSRTEKAGSYWMTTSVGRKRSFCIAKPRATLASRSSSSLYTPASPTLVQSARILGRRCTLELRSMTHSVASRASETCRAGYRFLGTVSL